jgi:hypothetical protein
LAMLNPDRLWHLNYSDFRTSSLACQSHRFTNGDTNQNGISLVQTSVSGGINSFGMLQIC